MGDVGVREGPLAGGDDLKPLCTGCRVRASREPPGEGNPHPRGLVQSTGEGTTGLQCMDTGKLQKGLGWEPSTLNLKFAVHKAQKGCPRVWMGDLSKLRCWDSPWGGLRGRSWRAGLQLWPHERGRRPQHTPAHLFPGGPLSVFEGLGCHWAELSHLHAGWAPSVFLGEQVLLTTALGRQVVFPLN